jgi:hypothetical protein
LSGGPAKYSNKEFQMGNKFQQQVKVVSREDLRPGTSTIEAAFFNTNGEPIDVGGAPLTPAANVSDITTADGSDAGTTQTLANATKATVNDILSALQDAGLMAESA